MSVRTEYPPGTFSWVEVATPDPASTMGFYGSLFGWEPEERPDPDGGAYIFLRKDGRRAAGCYERLDLPAAWVSHVTVADVEFAAARAAQHGGAVVEGPLSYGGDGRMALVADPEGAVLVLWQAGDHVGAEVVNEPGALTWNDLLTHDLRAARTYYQRLFDWTIEEIRQQETTVYAIIRSGERTNAGIMPMAEAHRAQPARWLPYFAVEDVDKAGERADDLGATIFLPPMDVPVGRIAGLVDPQGAVFAVFAGELDD